MSMGYGSMTSGDTQLRPYPGSMDSAEDWEGITEGNGWFCYRESNNWDSKKSGASIYITEGEPTKYWIKVKTHGLRKPTDTNESYRQRVRKHTNKVSRSWITAAKKMHDNPEINEVGNEIQMTWNEAFKKALEDPKVKPFLSGYGEGKTNKPKESGAIADPVNFTPRLEENMKKISYSAIVLDEKSHNLLVSTFKNVIPEGWKVFAHHVTIKMGELPADKKSEIGRQYNLTVTELGKSNKALAVKISGGWTTNKIPHITIAVNTKEGGKPFDSASIVDWKKVTSPIVLTGIVTELPY